MTKCIYNTTFKHWLELSDLWESSGRFLKKSTNNIFGEYINKECHTMSQETVSQVAGD